MSPEEALRLAQAHGHDPDLLTLYRHRALETARFGRGYAFQETTSAGIPGYVIIGESGDWATGILVDGESIDTVIARRLARAEHANREIPDDELGQPQRMAVAAFDAGAEDVDAHPDDVVLDYARYLLVILRRVGGQRTRGKAVLAGHDDLLDAADPERRYTHPCPFCARAALHEPRYPRAVCDACHDRATDRTGRRVTGFNIDMAGGFFARYVDPPEEECVEVTRTGVCYVDGRQAWMGEHRFGGIVVEAR